MTKDDIASTEADLGPQFSLDGTKIVFTSSRSGNYEIWVCDREARNPVQLTSSWVPQVGSPRRSSDGPWILYTQIDRSGSNLILVENLH